ncbi:CBU_0592 family membrane protein [Parvularcula sp. LCG005]|uniref:CBU_0592 family membrane protein n=1 Tax=Parvularcula sp. LCG005 TaxID=3078805 RepID=UPI002943CE19|nr:hypothetical protein [Parvularcula sp. LCG005]WOI52299.1 hypothetical protein RUI03_09050 [Parvularcula sp. LCG005]
MSEWTFSWHDAVGFLGVALLLGAYAALQFKKISADDPLYSAANGLAALLIAVSLLFNFNAASMVIEIFWFAISVYGFVRAVRKRNPKSD